MENRLNEKLSYLHSMLRKYYVLNKSTNDKYLETECAIQHEIDALEELKVDEPLNTWDECYEENLKESKLSINL